MLLWRIRDKVSDISDQKGERFSRKPEKGILVHLEMNINWKGQRLFLTVVDSSEKDGRHLGSAAPFTA